jgi:hypothetical protein
MRFKFHVFLTVIILVSFATPFAVAQQNQPRVAVLHLTNLADLTDQEAGYLTNLVRSSARLVLPLDEYIIMTKENIGELLGEVSMADCIGECAVEIGKKLGAAYVVAGEVVLFGGELRIALTLHETSVGNLLTSVQVQGKSILEIEDPLKAQSTKLFDPIILLLDTHEPVIFDETNTDIPKTGLSEKPKTNTLSFGFSLPAPIIIGEYDKFGSGGINISYQMQIPSKPTLGFSIAYSHNTARNSHDALSAEGSYSNTEFLGIVRPQINSSLYLIGGLGLGFFMADATYEDYLPDLRTFHDEYGHLGLAYAVGMGLSTSSSLDLQVIIHAIDVDVWNKARGICHMTVSAGIKF